MNFPDPAELERWRRRNICILRAIRAGVIGVIAAAVAWIAYRLLSP